MILNIYEQQCNVGKIQERTIYIFFSYSLKKKNFYQYWSTRRKPLTCHKYGRNTVITLCIMHICDSFLLTLCVILFIYFFLSENVINRSQSSQSSDDEPEADYQPPTLAPLSSFCNPTVPTSLHSPSHITQNQSGQSTSVPQQSFFSPVMQNFSDLLFSTEDTSTNQQIDFLDASLTDFLPTPH